MLMKGSAHRDLPMYAVRNYQQGIQRLCAACDEDLLGNVYTEEQFRLEASIDFYDGMRVDQEGLEAMLKQCTMANVVGQGAVDAALGLGFIEPENVRTVQGIPHAQMMVLLP
jgi:hypothetical protein